jgi:Class II Aldolase and Adducin N-terminal domain
MSKVYDPSIDLSAPRTEIVRAQVSAEEWQTRVDLAACYRLAAKYGWTDLIYTHISARVPGPQEHFLLNPFGYMFDEVCASTLVKVDLDGNLIGDTPHFIHRAGFIIHSAIHAARPDAGCVSCWFSRINHEARPVAAYPTRYDVSRQSGVSR